MRLNGEQTETSAEISRLTDCTPSLDKQVSPGVSEEISIMSHSQICKTLHSKKRFQYELKYFSSNSFQIK